MTKNNEGKILKEMVDCNRSLRSLMNSSNRNYSHISEIFKVLVRYSILLDNIKDIEDYNKKNGIPHQIDEIHQFIVLWNSKKAQFEKDFLKAISDNENLFFTISD